MYDLVIIGGGPTGINCGIEAGKAGLDYVILEKGTLVNSLYHFPINMTFFSTAAKLEIADIPFIAHHDKPTRAEALEYYRRLLEQFELNVKTYEPVTGMTPNGETGYVVSTSKATYETRCVIVATGYYDTPRLLDVPGEELPKVRHYYDDPHPYVGQQVLVIGAANSACDVALETFYKGAEVTMAIREHEIYPKVKYWIRPNIENRIREGNIKAYFNTTVAAIRPHEVDLQTPEGLRTIDNDFVLAMTGYQPDFDFLEQLGLRFTDDATKRPIYNENTLESNLPGVYVAGVVAAGLATSKLFIENTRHHGALIAEQVAARLSVPER